MSLRVTKPQINTRGALSKADLQIGAAGHNVLRATTPDQQFNMIGAGRRNLLINGDFQINQQNDVVYKAAPVDLNQFDNGYFIDRWMCDSNDIPDAKVELQYDNKHNFRYIKLHNDGPQGGNSGALQLWQFVEASETYRGKHMTFSAWVRSNHKFKLQMYDGVAYSDSQDITSVHSGDGSWELLVGRFVIPDVSAVDTAHLAARITRYDGSSWQVRADEYVCVAQAQLELGRTRTPFEQRAYSQELELCQRYFQRIDSWNVTPMWSYTPNDASAHMVPKTTMRRCPWFANNISGQIHADQNRTGLHGVHAVYHIDENIAARSYLYNADAGTMKVQVPSLGNNQFQGDISGGQFSLNFREESLGEFRYDVETSSGNTELKNFTKGGLVGAYSHGLGVGYNNHDQSVQPGYIILDAEIFHPTNT